MLITEEKKLCFDWRKEKLTREQNNMVDRLETDIDETEKITQQLFFLLDYYKEHTFDKIQDIEEIELALGYWANAFSILEAQGKLAPYRNQHPNWYPKEMLPMVNYETIGTEKMAFGAIAELEYNCTLDLCHFVEVLTQALMQEKKIQLPESIISHLCAYLGFLTATAFVAQEAMALTTHMIALIKSQANTSLRQFIKYLGSPGEETHQKTNQKMIELHVNSPGSIIAQTFKLANLTWEAMESLHENCQLAPSNAHEKQSDLFCSHELFIPLLSQITSDKITKYQDKKSLLFVINQVAFQIGWLIGHYAHFDKNLPWRYFEYALPHLALYSEIGAKTLKK